MNYREAMNNFSQCGLGMILAAQDNTILDINEAGSTLLCAEQPLQGKRLEEAAPFLCAEPESLTFGNPAFNQYLLATPTPDLDGLPAGTNILVFRDATKDYKYMLLENIFNLLDTAITVWDSNCRLLTLNDAAAKLEAHIISDVIGKTSDSLYEAHNNSILVVPEMTSQKKPLLNLRQDFITHSGKELQIVSNNYPIVESGELLGSVSMMEDYSKLDEMNKRIIQLQRSLLNKEKTSVPKKSGALSARYHFNDIIYQGDAMRGVIDKCKQISQSDSPVMIYGETGTGKELFAQSIHNASSRANAPFLAVNCAAIPDTLLESILFGTEKGAYTDAEKREGLFEQADTGSLLLDELNSMNTALQSKLLRVLQEGTLMRVGGSKQIHVDVRVLSNLNIPPHQAIEEGLLRKDLYYRLGVINITIPPLRDRKEDIMLLVKNFITAKKQKLLKNVTSIDPVTKEIFYAYDWPGNVRELQHAIEYAMNIIPVDISTITPDYIPEHILIAVEGEYRAGHQAFDLSTMDGVMQEAGRRFLNDALQEHGGNISQTAQAMGITRQNLQHRMKKLGVDASDWKNNTQNR